MNPGTKPTSASVSATVLALALGLAFIVLITFLAHGSGPEEVPRGLFVGLLLTVPGLIGLAGTVRGERVLLGSAGVLCLLQSMVAMSGVTLLFLVPAMAFLRAAALDPARRSTPIRWHPGRVALFVIVAVSLTYVVIRNGGIFGIVALILVGGLGGVAAARPAGPRVSRWSSVVVGLAVVPLVIGAWLALLTSTQTRCWVAREGPGGLVYESRPETDLSSPTRIDPTAVASGCDGGALTLEGATLAVVLAGGAVALAASLPPRRRPDGR